MADDVSADSEKQTVTGTLTVLGIDCTPEQIDKFTVSFVSENHCVLGRVVNGSYSVELIPGNTYSVRCFNLYQYADTVVTTSPIIPGSEMEYAFCKDFNFDGSTTTFDVTVEKGTEVTVGGCDYYIYPSSGFATLKQINVEYNTSNPGSNKIADYSVKENQTFTIPAEVQGCKVIFVGEYLSSEKSVILVPSATGGLASKFRALFQGNGNSVNIVFEGDVVLNCNPFTSMWNQKFGSGSAATDTQYKFNITFEKDVYVNSVSSYYSDGYHLSPSTLNLCGLASLDINGVYKGAFAGSGSVPEFTTEVVSGKSLTNTTIGRITFDRDLSFDAQAINTPNNKATKIASLYLLSNSVFDIEGNDVDGYKLTSSGVEVCSSVTSYKDAILFT
ncbi:MAG: hypothetical protein J5897_07310, partial [Candidatus Methanomethylophilus sp.]|nr:hypothetical protein [Methanomethylophilus sp.]